MLHAQLVQPPPRSHISLDSYGGPPNLANETHNPHAEAHVPVQNMGHDQPVHALKESHVQFSSPHSKVNASFGEAGMGMAISFKDITYTVNIKVKGKSTLKPILKGVTGTMRSGTLNAIMGPSGGGKTSLLDVLADRKPNNTVTGMVLTDGSQRDSKTYMHMAGYVVQDDIVMGTLTVRENLLFSARLRLPGGVDDEEKRRRVQEVIEELGLEKVADVRCGNEFVRGISGGERKRVNIGMELVMAPSVLYLDEPTTGLDAATSMSVLRLLKRLAEHGRTIILSIHQPRFKIFELFDSVLIMSQGEMLYQGKATGCVKHLASHGYTCDSFNNPADFIMDVVLGNEVRAGEDSAPSEELDQEVKRALLATQLAAGYQQSAMARKALETFEHDRAHPKPPGDTMHSGGTFAASWLTQVSVCSGRALANVVRNPATSVGQVGVNIVVGVLVGAIFWQLNGDMEPNRQIRGTPHHPPTRLPYLPCSPADPTVNHKPHAINHKP
ncbi:P-loop containing nucleoside triphosphate hydrolase protein [Baffinella frigidus]|nr:P-loop containing nucleoside triphosphate hydrolase protein [Cryptophyta sp. CCMP2293]